LLQTRGIAAPAVSTILKIMRSDRRSIAGAASAFGDHAHSPPINSWGAANLATAHWRFGILALVTSANACPLHGATARRSPLITQRARLSGYGFATGRCHDVRSPSKAIRFQGLCCGVA
jgi:hypothetical protein